MEQLLRVQEVGKALGVSGRQVWKLLAAGRVPEPVRLARSVRWRAGDLERFMAVGCNMDRFNAERQKAGAAR